MKGVIFNLFEEFVTENFGADAYESLLEKADLGNGGVFVGPGSYPDEDLIALLEQAVKATGLSEADALRAFGTFLLPKLIASHPTLGSRTREMTAKDFLLSIDSVIHIEVVKLMPDATPPRILCTDSGPDTLDLVYQSKRNLCFLIEGFFAGIELYFEEKIEFSHAPCGASQNEDCRFLLRFTRDV